MTIDLVCVYCGLSRADHMATFGRACSPAGFILMDSHALDDIPPARRAEERARLANKIPPARRVGTPLSPSRHAGHQHEPPAYAPRPSGPPPKPSDARQSVTPPSSPGASR